MKLLVCGSRFMRNYDTIYDYLKKHPEYDTIISGGANGADTLAEQAAARLGRGLEIYTADWENHGKAAGPRRNRQMLEEGKPDKVLAYLAKGSKGTRDMILRAIKAGIPVEVVTIGDNKTVDKGTFRRESTG